MDAIEYIIYTLLFLVLIAFIGVIAYIIYDNYTYKNNLTSDLNTNFIDINQNFNSTSNIIGTLHEKHSSNIGILGNRITDTNTVLSNNVIDINSRYNRSSNLFNDTVSDFNTRYNASSNLFKSTTIDYNTRYNSTSNLFKDNANNLNYNLNKYFTFTNAANIDGNKKIFEYTTAAVDPTIRLNLITKTTATAGLKLNTDTEKEFELCNSMGTKCFNMYSTDDSLSIYKPASQGGSKNIYIGGNDETAPLKIVGNKVFINGVEYIPPAAAATIVDAAATIALTQPVITAITVPVTSQGSGYSTTTPPTVVFNNGVPPVGGTLATATVLSTGITAGKIISVTLNSPGSGYTTPPTITFTGGGGGTGAAAIATLTPPAPTLTLTSPITITERGSGYKSAPTVVFNAGVPPVGGTLATATAALGTAVGTTDKVISVTLTSPGVGYTSAPTITFTGGR
jgi:hypothetical protein